MSTLIANTLQGINTIKYDGSTTAQTINSNGATALTVPHFFADESSSITVSSSATVHTGFTEISDSHGGFSGHTYTIPSGLTGIWCFNTAITFNSIGASTYALLTLQVNGSQVSAHDNYISSNNTNVPFRGIHMGSFSAGDTIRLMVAQGNGTKTSDPSGRTGFFSGWRMGGIIT